jgi:uncharacterized membrane protein
MRVRWHAKPEKSQSTVRNMDTMLKLEDEFLEQRKASERMADWVAQFAGSGIFIGMHVAIILGWLVLNSRLCAAWFPPFDPYPYNLLGTIVSLEGVILAAFVLIKQNRMSFRADHRSHLDLQVNLLAEQEITKILATVLKLSRHVGIKDEDAEAVEMANDTPLEEIARDLDKRLGER